MLSCKGMQGHTRTRKVTQAGVVQAAGLTAVVGGAWRRGAAALRRHACGARHAEGRAIAACWQRRAHSAEPGSDHSADTDADLETDTDSGIDVGATARREAPVGIAAMLGEVTFASACGKTGQAFSRGRGDEDGGSRRRRAARRRRRREDAE